MTDALLSALRARANSRGLVLATESTLLGDLGVGTAALRQALVEAEADGRVEVLAPLPFLVAKLPAPWSGRKSGHAETTAKTAASLNHAYSFQSSLSPSKHLKESYRQPTEDKALLKEILETLGESDPTTFRGAIRSYPAAVIRTALDRVRRMPTIRKNRTALFRYLLPRLAKEPPSIN